MKARRYLFSQSNPLIDLTIRRPSEQIAKSSPRDIPFVMIIRHEQLEKGKLLKFSQKHKSSEGLKVHEIEKFLSRRSIRRGRIKKKKIDEKMLSPLKPKSSKTKAKAKSFLELFTTWDADELKQICTKQKERRALLFHLKLRPHPTQSDKKARRVFRRNHQFYGD